MMININQNYSQFYRGTEQIKSYGATDSNGAKNACKFG